MKSVVVFVATAVAAFAPQGDGIIRLKPREFRQLPAAIRRNLETRRCTIPQYSGGNAAHNVINGSFIARGSRDWAVLCSIKGVSRILVYRSGSTKRVDSVALRPDAVFMQVDGNGVMQFSRKIDIATPKNIADHATEYGTAKPSPLDHNGIDDGFMGKASTILYCSRGKWRELPGAD
jgi:hypothetical protein